MKYAFVQVPANLKYHCQNHDSLFINLTESSPSYLCRIRKSINDKADACRWHDFSLRGIVACTIKFYGGRKIAGLSVRNVETFLSRAKRNTVATEDETLLVRNSSDRRIKPHRRFPK